MGWGQGFRVRDARGRLLALWEPDDTLIIPIEIVVRRAHGGWLVAYPDDTHTSPTFKRESGLGPLLERRIREQGEAEQVERGQVRTDIRTMTAPTSDLTEVVDFTTAGGYVGTQLPTPGVRGRGPETTMYTLRANSSTKAALVPAQTNTASTSAPVNPLWFARAPQNTTNYLLSAASFRGSDQGHMYNGLQLVSATAATLTRLSFVNAAYGNAAGPPGETFVLSANRCTSLFVADTTIDGGGVAATGFGINSTTGLEVRGLSVQNCKFWGAAFWQVAGITTYGMKLTGNGLGLNHERCNAGPIRHYNLTIGVPASYGVMHMTLNDDLGDNGDVEIHLAGWTGGHYAATQDKSPFCLSISSSYDVNGDGVKSKQVTVPKVFLPDGSQMQLAEAGIGADSAAKRGVAPVPSSNVGKALADPDHWGVIFR